MAASGTFQLPIYRAKTGLSITKDVIECAEVDYRHILKSIAAQEIAGQQAIGNKPTNIIEDGKTNKPITEVQWSVVAYFIDAAALIAAISGAHQMLKAYGRRVTGKTLGSGTYYQQQGRTGLPTPVTSFNPASINRATDLYIAFPVAHVRKWQWLSKTGGRMTRTSRDKKRNPKIGPKNKVSRSVFELVASRMKSRYLQLDVLASYIPVHNLNTGGRVAVDRIPAIKVRIKIKGRV